MNMAGHMGTSFRTHRIWAGPVLFLATFLLWGTTAQAASFECAGVTKPDEKTICNNRGLNDQDVRMATLYDVLGHLVGMGARGALQDAQKEWLTKRAACGTDETCLNEAYESRLNTLRQGLQDIYSRGPY